MTDVGADVLGNIAEFMGGPLPGARVQSATYPLASCLTKEGDTIQGCKYVRDSMQIIHSAIFDFVQAQASVDYSITGIAVTFEFPSLPEDPDPDPDQKTLTGKSFWWSPVSLHSLQKNEFNQWYMADHPRDEIRAKINELDDAFWLENDLAFAIMLHNSVSTERVQWLLQQLIQVLRDTVPADRWRGFQFIPKNVELVEGPVTPWGQMPSQIECRLQYKYDKDRQGPMTEKGFPLDHT